jgi:hypothetical protein
MSELFRLSDGRLSAKLVPTFAERGVGLVNSVLNLRVPQNAEKLSSGLTTCGLSSTTQLHGVSYIETDGYTDRQMAIRPYQRPFI